jgi:predicted O-methyltransferase YrrM
MASSKVEVTLPTVGDLRGFFLKQATQMGCLWLDLSTTTKLLLSATVKQMVSGYRLEYLNRLLYHWIYMTESRLAVRYLSELWPAITDIRAQPSVGISHTRELPYGERTILDALVRYLRPRTLFEFGTFTGTTTRLLADAAPDGAVTHTLDFPEAHELVGREFRDKAEYRDKIILHRCDSRRFNFEPFRGQMELIFVDAGHKYSEVLHDSKRALQMLAPRGVIVWDDYQACQPGVVRALNELASHIELIHVAASRLVIHSRPAFGSVRPRQPKDYPRRFLGY